MTNLEIFSNRKFIGKQLTEFIKGEGYTKISFGKKINIKMKY